ncbi:UvrD-helicase domain-containing protein [Azospira restricta]|uniref:DNA 3'-5' helicase n=1 Tax=Azospira restricta TaxID=404405 RepID=A0A974PYN1_9RHOO|nr:UvrD-helicase domain-containing protein [Azospira restricta]QRJ63395.1 UvrD-helicase domain-containing protein [Azospira restricta]
MSSTPEPAPDFSAALDPARSAVVEACAGSGKTWLLASRIVRLLLAGAQPAEILAITFTRKAAAEIEERVVDWLRLLATAADDEARRFLAERGAGDDAATLRRARGLYERVTGAPPGLAVNTFHGWFLQLVAVAPLSANLAGTTLADDGERRFEELWQSFARRLQRDPAGAAAQAFVRLLATVGLASTRTLLARGMARRAEWLAHVGGEAEPVAAVVGGLGELFGVAGDGAALAAFFAPGWDAEFHAYLGFLEMSELDSDRRLGAQLAAALAGEQALDERFAAVAGVLLTGTGTLRSRKPSKTLDKRFGADAAARFLDLHAALGARLLDCLAQQQEEKNLAFNRDALTVHNAFLAHLDAFKAERRQIDFVDAEWRVLGMLNDEASAAFVQARLDARYRHVLLDEFQDTNPLQWQILQAWLAAYSDAARPSVFLVGDPKQSIYRFRRAEPRLFACATEFLAAHFAAARLTQDATRRNAPAIVDVVNALFGAEPGFRPFRPQHSLAAGLPGRVELLPLCTDEDVPAGDAAGAAATPAALRDPLREPAADAADRRREREAGQLAERLAGMLGRTLVRDGAAERSLRPGDVLLLVRTRARIKPVEKALAAAGIPFAAASRGGLLDALEVRDLVALLEFLVTPAADLQLAHALKSPLFACSDDDLLRLAARAEAGWRARLVALAGEGGGSAALRRAARLIEAWLPAAARLPAHDLLDRIYAEGEVLARYRLAVPEARRGAALANLEALLLLALDLDGGRYPSLPRFIDELRALVRAAGDDAPDEGELAADEAVAADGRVRIMTIHGAKGLEAPLVWLLDANAPPPSDKAWEVLVAWPPEAPRPTHFSFVGRREERGASRQALFEAEAAAAAREELNLLYVAITRAKQIFIASGVANARKGDAASAYDRLQAALARLGAESAYGDELASAAVLPALAVGPAAAPAPSPALPAVGERREAPDAAARFGILVHAILERRTEARADEGWWRALGYADVEARRAGVVAERLLAAPALRRFFDPACYRRAWNEMEIAGEDGTVGRIDRLVEDDEAFWVLDYKSSGPDTPRLDDYRAQVAAYCRALAAIFAGKPVRGALIFADATLLEIN